MQILLDIIASIALAYALIGAAYVLRLSWSSITARLSGLIAALCVWALWPVVMWSEAEHVIRERRRARSYRIPSREYLEAVARLSREKGARERCPR